MTVDYKPIANDVSANVESQAQYITDLAPGGSLEHGYQQGTAQSAKVNKTLRQCSMISAAVANLISNQLGQDVLDDGNLAGLITNLTNAILTLSPVAFTTGDVKLTLKTAADSGWILCNDGTIGDASSAASTRANADCQALFTLLWTNVADTYAPVVGGRGVSAAADWAAHKKITLTKTLGRAISVYGSGSGLTARALGQTVGEETHVLTNAEIPTHTHDMANHTHGPGTFSVVVASQPNSGSGGGVGKAGTYPVTGTSATPSVNTTGNNTNVASGAAHNVMQPTVFMNAMIKL